MSQRFAIDQWPAAHAYAKAMANRLNLDVAIRKAKEYGKSGLNVSLACRADSDYHTAEIVKPDHRDN